MSEMTLEELERRLREGARGLADALDAISSDDLRRIGVSNPEAMLDEMRWLLERTEVARQAAAAKLKAGRRL